MSAWNGGSGVDSPMAHQNCYTLNFFLQQTSFEKEKRNISYFINLYFNVKEIIKEKYFLKITVLFLFKSDEKKNKNS